MTSPVINEYLIKDTKALKDAYKNYNKVISVTENPLTAPVLFSNEQYFNLGAKVNEFQEKLKEFVEHMQNDINLQNKLKINAIVAYNQLIDLGIFHGKDVDNNTDINDILVELEKLTQPNQKARLYAKFSEYQKMQQDLIDKKNKDLLADPSLTHGIISQLYQQMRYDPLGNIAASLMKAVMDALFNKHGIEALPEPKEANSQEGAMAEMFRRMQLGK